MSVHKLFAETITQTITGQKTFICSLAMPPH
jgi:hypothetical protein